MATGAEFWSIRCAITSCRFSSRKHPSRRFFIFPPRGSPKYKAWLLNCSASAGEIKCKRKPYICDVHFNPKYFSKKYLKKDAIPTLFLDSPSDGRPRSPSPVFNPNLVLKTYEKTKVNPETMKHDTSEASITDDQEDLSESLAKIENPQEFQDDECKHCSAYATNKKIYVKRIELLNNRIRGLETALLKYIRNEKILRKELVKCKQNQNSR